ncbi:MAG: hypothetical protein E5V62_21810 [Mesorhizobium sp.]|uniref:hypothetical protein n=1 Tax=Mesorhizobium sp. TaxID=1871066 RepID=UPI000FD1DE79|nr:hypothetical protein [Mesorhizobium sp.]RVD69943.1 hypothetical protein EN751_23340 [Mesorhizobium sp. M4A.F.Ca.ET.029.04.2.1]TIW33157.1 MAG: hypothetical protein E5V62_21810 [Mesorhizobium sp.]
MTAFLRNALLAAVAVTSMAGSALADQTVSCAETKTNDLWSGRCCGTSDSSCLGGGHEHGNHGGRGGQTGAK